MKDETYKKLIVGILFNELWFEKKKSTLSPTEPIHSHYVFTTCVALNIIISANMRLNIPFFLMCKHLITHVERKKK